MHQLEIIVSWLAQSDFSRRKTVTDIKGQKNQLLHIIQIFDRSPNPARAIRNLPNALLSWEPQNFYDLSREAMELKTFLSQLETICAVTNTYFNIKFEKCQPRISHLYPNKRTNEKYSEPTTYTILKLPKFNNFQNENLLTINSILSKKKKVPYSHFFCSFVPKFKVEKRNGLWNLSKFFIIRPINFFSLAIITKKKK